MYSNHKIETGLFELHETLVSIERSLKFLLFSAIQVLYPYLTIHMRELGINVEETAIMSAVSPVISIFMPPLAGMIADKIGNFRVSHFELHVFSNQYNERKTSVRL